MYVTIKISYYFVNTKGCYLIMDRLEKIFPTYFENFELPEGAKEQTINVFRACRTNLVEKESFLPSFEEKGYCYTDKDDPTNPSVYSLSTYEKPKDVKRFAITNSEYKKPFKIARGVTEPSCGPSQRTKEREKKRKDSHVDWWLYEGAEPFKSGDFNLIDDFEKFLSEFNKKRELE